MKNKFRIGEIVIVNGKSEIYQKHIKAIGIIESKDYYYNEYLVNILSQNKEDWFKYKVALAINIKGLDYIYSKVRQMPNKYNNIFDKVDFYKEFKAFKRRYAILIWTSTYWTENNFAVKCIQESLKELRKQNIAYKQIIIGETDPTYIKINEFIDNDDNVDIFNIFHKIELKSVGGILA